MIRASKITPWVVCALVVVSGAVVSSWAGTKLKALKKEPPKLVPDTGEDIRSVMHFFYDRLIELRPVITSEIEFSDPKNRKTIRLALADVEARLKNTKSAELLSGEGHQATVELFKRHLADTRESLDLGEITRAYQGVRMTTEFCVSCHTHLPQEGMPQLDWKKDVLARDPKDVRQTADFYFVTRRYDYSLNIYNYLLREFPKTVLQEADMRDIYRRKMVIYARIKRDPAGAIADLNEDLKNTQLPVSVRREIETWRQSFEGWLKEEVKAGGSKAGSLNPSPAQRADALLKELEGYRGPSDSQPYMVNLLKVSGFLYESLYQAKSSEEKARNLFHLGRVERILGQSSFVLLGDLYLKECVRTAPQSEWAAKCLTEYKTYLQWRYPPGTKRPAFLDQELKELEGANRT